MASPVDAGRATTNISTAADPWATVNLPASIAAGNLLIAYGRTGGIETFNLPTGWSWLVQNDTSDATNDNVSLIYKWADGAEGASFSWDLSAAAKGGAITWRITGAEHPSNQLPEVLGANFTTTLNTADPPSMSPIGGSKDYLIIVVSGNDGEVGAYTAAPTNYVNLSTASSGTAGTPSTNNFNGGATRAITTATENPGVFTHAAATAGGRAFTIAVHPAGGAPLPPPRTLARY